MNTQEFRNLQEAYLEVVENQQLEEGLDRKTFEANRKKAARSAASADAKKRGHVDKFTGKPYSTAEAKSRRRGIHTPEKAPERDAARDAAGGETGRGGRLRPNKVRKAKALGELGEQNDIYDIILSHLIHEGYADTLEAAQGIMVNMSEEWRENIMEISQKTATSAYAQSKTGEFEGQDSPRDVKRTDNLRGQIKRKFGDKAAKHADRAAHSRTFGRKGAGGMPPKP